MQRKVAIDEFQSRGYINTYKKEKKRLLQHSFFIDEMAQPIPAHEASGQTENAVLDLFTVPATDTSIHSYRMVTVDPTSRSINPVEFNIPGGRDYIDLSRSYFKMELKLLNGDGGNIVDATNTWLASNAFHTIIKQPSVYLNGTLITEQTDTYAYKAYLETIMNYDKEAAETYLEPQGFYSAMDHTPEITANNINTTANAGAGHNDYQALSSEAKKAFTNAWRLKNRIKDGKTLQLLGKPHIDIFQVRRLLVPSVDLKMRFTLNEASFFCNGITDTAQLTQENFKMEFIACLVRVRSDKFNDISEMRLRQMKSVYYPTVRSEIRSFTIPANTRTWEETDIFNGRIPDRTIVGLVHQNAYNGGYKWNPFSFQKFGIKNIKQIIEGEEYPDEALEMNHDNGQLDMEGYYRLITAGCLNENGRSMLAYKHWGQNKNTTLFMWNNVASGCQESDDLNPRQQGRLKIYLQLGDNVNHGITVIIYGEFENMLEIKPTGSVQYDIYRQQMIVGRVD